MMKRKSKCDLDRELDEVFDDLCERNNRSFELYDEIVMLLATELGLDINELMKPIIDEESGYYGCWSFLLADLIGMASPLKTPRVVALLKEYDELERPFWDVIKAFRDDDRGRDAA